ncbi:MAG TPA: biotin carboxylase N-terminal domain-containing protein, partial [Candidatus Dormibacteraeota bacterium]|nr:biotin carboxylase N-terminal domain-containing protein [Candidatus Dormibacteraeota bacterium]
MLQSVLVANRGEIARRVIRGCRALGVRSIAVYSDADQSWPHVADADEAVAIGPAPARQSYLDIERILDAARRTGAQAIHPGYGFLSENWRFAQACEAAGLIFVGPSWRVIQQMGDKIEARRLMAAAGVPVVPGSDGPVDSVDAAREVAARAGYPVMLKAAAGGGGIGMVKVADEAGLPAAFASAQRRAQAAFGSGGLFLERYVERARHVEVQVFGDPSGSVVHLHERECSIQR